MREFENEQNNAGVPASTTGSSTNTPAAPKTVRRRAGGGLWVALAIVSGALLVLLGMVVGSVLSNGNTSLATAFRSLFSTETPTEEGTGTSITYEEFNAEESVSTEAEEDVSEEGGTTTGGTGTTVSGTRTVVVTHQEYPQSNPNGLADLAVIKTASGIYNTRDDIFTERSSIELRDLRSHEEIAVRFTIENQGDKTAPSWKFEAELPTQPRQTFRYNSSSYSDSPMLPSAGREYTLTFDEVRTGNVEVRIVVDPNNELPESTTANNTAVISFNVGN